MSHQIYSVLGSSQTEEIPTFVTKIGHSQEAPKRWPQTALNHQREDVFIGEVTSESEALKRERGLKQRLAEIPNAGGSGKEFYCFHLKRFGAVYELLESFYFGGLTVKWQPFANRFSPLSESSLLEVSSMPLLNDIKKRYLHYRLGRKFNLK
tara:strand:- start:2758 stop:3213 length:456 start_codon:yes stop_codon:yes gene_type:complete